MIAHYFYQHKRGRKGLGNYYVAVNKHKAVFTKHRVQAVDICATEYCKYQKLVRTKAMRQIHGRST